MAARNGSGKSASTQPMPVEQITKEAQTYDYNPLIPLKYWLRSAGTLVKEVGFTPLKLNSSRISNVHA
jgi:STAM-binding protein